MCEDLCPCGSRQSYAQCCEPFITGKKWPETAESLMRSRYAAYVKGQYDWLMDSTHPDFREGLDVEKMAAQGKDVHWLRLEMGQCLDAQPVGEHGELYDTVEFRAFYEIDGIARQLGECSFFKKKDDKIYYVDGVALKQASYKRAEPKVGRNDPCPCGSGKKYKKCCGAAAH